ncbi:MAG TPA: phosphate-starvation-inducible PsiE family protein [Ktedonobacterales bacterium]
MTSESERVTASAQTPAASEAAATPAVGARRRAPTSSAWTSFLDHFDTVVYVAVGVCFLAAAVISLVYSVAAFAWQVTQPSNHSLGAIVEGGAGPQAIINLVSDLLLTMIIMEVASTVTHYLRDKATSVKPFLFIGIISGTRGILAVGARLSVANVTGPDFLHAMVELAVNAGVIIALSIAMRLIGNYLNEGPTPAAPAPGADGQ